MRCSICNCKIDSKAIQEGFDDLCNSCTRWVKFTINDPVPLHEKRPISHQYATEGLQEPIIYQDN